jgi:hypothetical protein
MWMHECSVHGEYFFKLEIFPTDGAVEFWGQGAESKLSPHPLPVFRFESAYFARGDGERKDVA